MLRAGSFRRLLRLGAESDVPGSIATWLGGLLRPDSVQYASPRAAARGVGPTRKITIPDAHPGAQLQSAEELVEFVRNHTQTWYHPVGTCKMGHDALAVVDEQLRVRGTEGLRVVDASIMPTIVNGNTNAATIMI